MRVVRHFILTIFIGATTSALAMNTAVTPIDPSLRDEVLARIEMMSEMQMSAESILNNVELSITPRAREMIMAYGATPDEAVPKYLQSELARRKAWTTAVELKRAHRQLINCLAEDGRLDEYRLAIEDFLRAPNGRFDAVTATANVPVNTVGLRACLNLIPDAFAASVRAGLRPRANSYWCILTETNLALEARGAELARHPLRRTLGQTRDGAVGAYQHLKNTFFN